MVNEEKMYYIKNGKDVIYYNIFKSNLFTTNCFENNILKKFAFQDKKWAINDIMSLLYKKDTYKYAKHFFCGMHEFSENDFKIINNNLNNFKHYSENERVMIRILAKKLIGTIIFQANKQPKPITLMIS